MHWTNLKRLVLGRAALAVLTFVVFLFPLALRFTRLIPNTLAVCNFVHMQYIFLSNVDRIPFHFIWLIILCAGLKDTTHPNTIEVHELAIADLLFILHVCLLYIVLHFD